MGLCAAMQLDALLHELSSPLSVIKVSTELIAEAWDDVPPEMRAQVLQRLTRATERMEARLAYGRTLLPREAATCRPQASLPAGCPPAAGDDEVRVA